MRKITEEDLDRGELIDIDEFVGSCISGDLTDYDGHGHMVDDDDIFDRIEVGASDYNDIPESITHILWFKH